MNQDNGKNIQEAILKSLEILCNDIEGKTENIQKMIKPENSDVTNDILTRVKDGEDVVDVIQSYDSNSFNEKNLLFIKVNKDYIDKSSYFRFIHCVFLGISFQVASQYNDFKGFKGEPTNNAMIFHHNGKVYHGIFDLFMNRDSRYNNVEYNDFKKDIEKGISIEEAFENNIEENNKKPFNLTSVFKKLMARKKKNKKGEGK